MSGYSEADFPQQVLNRLSRRLEISVNNIRICNRNDLGSISPDRKGRLSQASTSTAALMPIYTSTALQIGLIANDNVPDLIPALLPSRAGAYSSRFLRKWLLNPPPAHMADHMRNLCTVLMHGTEMPEELEVPKYNGIESDKIDWQAEILSSQAEAANELSTAPTRRKTALMVPRFTPVSIAKVVTLINANQCNVALFKEIRNNMNALQMMLQNAHAYRDSLTSGDAKAAAQSYVENDCSVLVEPLLALTSF
jgi:hypothetical protein